MFYKTDFKIQQTNLPIDERNVFTVLLNNFIPSVQFPKASIAHATKPLVYFSRLFGMQTIRYCKDDVRRLNIYHKLYSLFIIAMIINLVTFATPLSWLETKSDIPLNILTKLFGFIQIFEMIYYIFIGPFRNSEHYLNLYKTLNGLDDHLKKRKRMFLIRRLLAISLMCTPLILVSFTFYLRKFSIRYIASPVTFFLIMVQGVNFMYFIVNIFIEFLFFKAVLMNKILKEFATKRLILKQYRLTSFFVKMFVNFDGRDMCWLELMQMYDKIADCVYLFNTIYAGQILIMFDSWLLTTVLVICRYLSPTLKYLEVISSDLFYYTFLNIRPLFLTKMSDFLIQERRKILSGLVHVLVYGDDDKYIDQVQTMIELVQSRKLELSGVVCTVNMPIMIAFAGRVLSYSVLVIQYFYINNIQLT